MNIFIDTNIFLSFYHLTKEDIEELKKLVALLDNGSIQLHLPEQVRDEFFRNRENKLKDALKSLQSFKFAPPVPAFLRAYDEFKEFKKAASNAEKKYSELLETSHKDAVNSNLHADLIISDIFAKSTMIAITDEIFNSANRRVNLGNPPGKPGSMGDAVNWEALLASIDIGKSLFIVSEDKDYVSDLSDDIVAPFLAREWKNEKNADLVLYRSISGFFKAKFPNISLASEIEKELTIANLANSPNFASTHITIGKLNTYADFSIPQIEQLVTIAESNSQVTWIIQDQDVRDFYKRLLLQKNITELLAAKILLLLGDGLESDENDEIPF